MAARKDHVAQLVLAAFALAFLVASAIEPAGKMRGAAVLMALALACLAAVDWLVTWERPARQAPAAPSGLGRAKEAHVSIWHDNLPEFIDGKERGWWE